MVMKRVANPWAGAVLAVLLTVLLPAGQARAESEILESDVQALPVGTKLADDARVVIPENKKLRVLLVASGNTRTLKGPYEGTVGDYKEDLSWWERITGRNKEPDAPIGATRGLKPQN
jgi:hypothetical protein